jgi:hypothetical protein
MTLDTTTRRSRRALLAAAAGSAAGIAIARMAAPEAAAATSIPLNINEDNASTLPTTITAGGAGDVFAATTTSAAPATAIYGLSSHGVGVKGQSGDTSGVVGSTNAAAGVVGLSSTGTGLMGVVGNSVPAVIPGVAVHGYVASQTQVGIRAHGRVQFPDRSGTAVILPTRSSVARTVTGVTSGNYAIATLRTNRPGVWVRAVVCSADRITIYLNTTVSAATSVAWVVLG